MSPITIVLPPALWNAAQVVSPWNGCIVTSSTTAPRSPRGTLIFATPFFTSGFMPVIFAMRSASGSAATTVADIAAARISTSNASGRFIVHLLPFLDHAIRAARAPSTLVAEADHELHRETERAGGHDHERLRHPLGEHQRSHRAERDHRRREIDDGPTTEHDRRTGDRTRRRRRDAVDESLDGAVAREATEVRRGDDDEEIARQEHAERRGSAAVQSGDEVPDERRRDDDRTRRDHRDGDCVEELPIRQPVEPLDDAAVEKRHDREAAPEHECPRFREV